MTLYVGNKEIKSTEELEQKTPLGNSLVEVIYTDDSKEILPKQMADRLTSLKQVDISEFQHLRCSILADLLFSIIREYGMKWNEFTYVMTLLKTSVEKHREAAEKTLYGKAREEVTLLDIAEILKNNKATLDDILSGGN